MRKYRYIISIVALAASFSAAGVETMYVGGPGGSNEKTYREKIIPAFESKTGSKVVYVTGVSTDILAKLQAQKDRQQISLAVLDDSVMFRAIAFGLCARVEESPVMKQLYPNASVFGDRAIGTGIVATGLAYNKSVFAKNGWKAPTSWQDLTDPKYKKKIVIPSIGNSYGLLALVMMAKVNGGSEDNIDPGFEAMTKKVAPNVLAWESSSAKVAELLQTGEAALAVWGSGRTQAVIDQGAPVAFVHPKEGAVALLSASCVVQGAPQPKLAQQFLQYLLSPEVQAIMATEIGLGPVNKATKLPPDIARKVPFGPEVVNTLVTPNYAVINSKRGFWTNRWNREVER